MKKILFPLLSCVIISTLVGCESIIESVENSKPPILHTLKLDVRNEAGENLCEKLLNEPIKSDKRRYYISTDKYKHRQAGKPLNSLFAPMVDLDSVGHATICCMFGSFDNPFPEIEYYFTCPTIFGDKKEHAIVSYWEESEDKYEAACYKATVDGKEVPVSLSRSDPKYTYSLTTDHEYTITFVVDSKEEQ